MSCMWATVLMAVRRVPHRSAGGCICYPPAACDVSECPGESSGSGSSCSMGTRGRRSGSGSGPKILTADQLEYQLIKGDLRFMIGASKANQLSIQEHGVVASVTVEDNLFAVHARPSSIGAWRPIGFVHPQYSTLVLYMQ